MNDKNIDDQDLNKSVTFLKKGNYFEALKILENLIKRQDHYIVHWYLGHTFFNLHNYVKAIKHIERSIELKSKDSINLNFLGQLYLEINEFEKAKKKFEEVLNIEKGNKQAILNLAKLNLDFGKSSVAEKYYKELSLKDPLNFSYHHSLVKINNNYLNEDLLKKIENNKNHLRLNDQIYMHLILAKKNEIKKEYKTELNNLLKAHKAYSDSKQKPTLQQFNFYSNLLPKFIKKLEGLDLKFNSDFKPIFIMGLPRSGTTLVEKIIVSGENKIQNLGETDVFDKVFFANQIIKDYENENLLTNIKFNQQDFEFLLKQINYQYFSQGLKKENYIFTDKSISNFLYIKLINKIFPKAKFVYCYRNPVANIIGILRSFLPNIFWSHDLDKIFSICDLYFGELNNIKNDKSVNFYYLSLEELTSNPTLVSQNLYKYLELKWTAKCLDYNKNEISFKTASNLQVREKIQKHNLNYTKEFLKLFKELGYDYTWLR